MHTRQLCIMFWNSCFQFEIPDVFHSLSALIHMICDGGDVPETATCFEFKCSLVKSICKMNSYILKPNINCIIQYFVFLSVDKDFQSAGKSEPLTYFIWGGKNLIKDITYLQLPQLTEKNKPNAYTPGILSGKDF